MGQLVRCARAPWSLLFLRTFLGAASALLPSTMAAETAVLECVRNAAVASKKLGSKEATQTRAPRTLALRPGALLAFNMSTIGGWKVSRGMLLLHVTGPALPAQVEVTLLEGKWIDDLTPPKDAEARKPDGKSAVLDAYEERDGWLRVELPPELHALGPDQYFLIREVAAKKPAGKPITIDPRESVQFSPYLIVEGKAPARPPALQLPKEKLPRVP
jgi:hypothetical protein